MIDRKTHKIDATDISFGRLCTNVANLLRGKTKATYIPYIDNGDFVIISNPNKVKITGKKVEQKEYYSHSGFPGGLKTRFMKNLSNEKIIRSAVYQMLPNNKTRKIIIKRLSFSNK